MAKMHRQYRLIQPQTGAVVIANLEIACTPWSRLRGWMWRRDLPLSSGILIQPCRSIHTMWMRMRIDAAFLDKGNMVLGACRNIGPWRIVIAPRGTHSVLETPAGQTDIPIGAILEVEEVKPCSKWRS